MVTIKDVAKHVNVAVSTASRAINDTGYVSEETRAKVLRAVKELGYKPNSIARSLKNKITYSIGLILSDIGNPFFGEVAQAVERTAREEGYSLLLCNTNNDAQQEEDCLSLLLTKQVDGIIWFSPINEELAETATSKSKKAIVTITGKYEHLGTHSVHIDDQIGAFTAVEHLIRLGHTRIGYIAEPEGPQLPRVRLNGYKLALEKYGLKMDPELIIHGTYKVESGLKATKSFLEMENPPTAIFAANDIMAVEALQCIKDAGLRVPEDIAVVGFDDIMFSKLRGIDLTTIAQPKLEMGSEAAKLLIASLKEEITSRQIILKPSLVIRNTCGYHLKGGYVL